MILNSRSLPGEGQDVAASRILLDVISVLLDPVHQLLTTVGHVDIDVAKDAETWVLVQCGGSLSLEQYGVEA